MGCRFAHHIHIHIHIHIRIHIHIHIRIHIHIHIDTRTRAGNVLHVTMQTVIHTLLRCQYYVWKLLYISYLPMD